MADRNYVVLDIEKPNQTFVDLTPNFQGRVGDSRTMAYIWIKRNGLPLNLTNRNVSFTGKAPDGKVYTSVGYAVYDEPGASRQAGRVAFVFPAGLFRAEGVWDPEYTYFYVDNGNGERISTIGVRINVLGSVVDMEVNAAPYQNEMDKVVGELREYRNAREQQIDQIMQDLGSTKAALQAMQTQIGVYQDLINAKTVPTKEEMETYLDSKLQSQDWNQDLNLCLNAGTTYNIISGGVSNNPANTAGTLMVSGRFNSLVQIFYDTQNQAWHRVQVDGAWSNWVLNTDFA